MVACDGAGKQKKTIVCSASAVTALCDFELFACYSFARVLAAQQRRRHALKTTTTTVLDSHFSPISIAMMCHHRIKPSDCIATFGSGTVFFFREPEPARDNPG